MELGGVSVKVFLLKSKIIFHLLIRNENLKVFFNLDIIFRATKM